MGGVVRLRRFQPGLGNCALASRFWLRVFLNEKPNFLAPILIGTKKGDRTRRRQLNWVRNRRRKGCESALYALIRIIRNLPVRLPSPLPYKGENLISQLRDVDGSRFNYATVSRVPRDKVSSKLSLLPINEERARCFASTVCVGYELTRYAPSQVVPNRFGILGRERMCVYST